MIAPIPPIAINCFDCSIPVKASNAVIIVGGKQNFARMPGIAIYPQERNNVMGWVNAAKLNAQVTIISLLKHFQIHLQKLKILAILVLINKKAMTGYHDYLIVLTPTEHIIGDVKDLKNFSAAMIGDFENRYLPAHISVQHWPRKKPEWIEPLLPKLERDLQTLSPVVFDINGFDFFDEQYNPTIYARINYNPSVEVWLKKLRKYFSKSDAIPHIAIVTSIPHATFNKLWPHFKNRAWDRRVKIDKLTILRRESIGTEKNYEVFKEIPFNPRLDFYAFTNAKLKTQTMPINAISTQQFSLF